MESHTSHLISPPVGRVYYSTAAKYPHRYQQRNLNPRVLCIKSEFHHRVSTRRVTILRSKTQQTNVENFILFYSPLLFLHYELCGRNFVHVFYAVFHDRFYGGHVCFLWRVSWWCLRKLSDAGEQNRRRKKKRTKFFEVFSCVRIPREATRFKWDDRTRK